MSPQKRLPDPVPRPALALWIWERALNWKEAGEYFSMSWEALRTACLPFADPARTIPRKENLQRIFELTEGAISPDSFHQLQGPPTGASSLVAAH